jgi:hypothetical protein
MKISRHIQPSGESPALKLAPLELSEYLVDTIARRLLLGTRHMEVIGLTLLKVDNDRPQKSSRLEFAIETGTEKISKIKNLEKTKELVRFELICENI